MAQEVVIVQITHFCILIYIYIYIKIVTKCNISVKARDRKNDISIEWSLYILGYKYVAMLQLPFEAHVLFSISLILLIGDWRWVLFPLLLQVANICKIASVFAFHIKEWFNMLQAHLLVTNNWK